MEVITSDGELSRCALALPDDILCHACVLPGVVAPCVHHMKTSEPVDVDPVAVGRQLDAVFLPRDSRLRFGAWRSTAQRRRMTGCQLDISGFFTELVTHHYTAHTRHTHHHHAPSAAGINRRTYIPLVYSL